MTVLSGLFLTAAFVFAVVFGGQTRDFTWGPGLVALGVSIWLAGVGVYRLKERGWAGILAVGAVMLAVLWIFRGAAASPVKEFARADALLVSAALAAFVWTLFHRPDGVGWRVLSAGLSGLSVANLVLAVIQKGNPDFAGLFGSRPEPFPSGLFGHYNHLADFSLVAAVMLAARALLSADRVWERLIAGMGALSAVACVILSLSRGGMLSLSIALLVLTAASLGAAWRRRSRWFGPISTLAVFAAVLVGITGIAMVKTFQQKRGGEGEVTEIADSAFRLGMIGLALDLTERHPWTGGGSRSFSWEKYEAWDLERNNRRVSNDDFVHNGAMQLAVEYGWTGLILVGLAIFACGVVGFGGLVSGDAVADRGQAGADAVACGCLAALAGTVFHSNFSFVHHTLPGALYLGLAMGGCLPWKKLPPSEREEFHARWIPGLGLLLVLFPAVVLVRTGWAGTKAYREAWPVLFAKGGVRSVGLETAVDHLMEAYDIWPSAEFPAAAAAICRAKAQTSSAGDSGEESEWLERADRHYQKAIASQPYDPEWAINRANVLSLLGRASEADAEFRKGIALQGKMEGGFQGKYYFASHLYREGYRLWTRERQAGKGLAMFLEARSLLAEAEKESIGKAWVAVRNLSKGLEKSISFLEGAGIRPETEEGVR